MTRSHLLSVPPRSNTALPATVAPPAAPLPVSPRSQAAPPGLWLRRAWYRGLGRPQGLAISREGDIYLAACLHGRHGLVRVTPRGEASLVVAGEYNLVGVAFSPLGIAILATNEAVYDVDLGVEGLSLF